MCGHFPLVIFVLFVADWLIVVVFVADLRGLCGNRFRGLCGVKLAVFPVS